MSNEKLKVEAYTNFGGMNSKSSPYVTSPMEFLNLANFDFQTIGSLTQRWGSTQYFGQTFPGQVNSLYEYSRLDGASYVVSSYSGGVYFGATTGQNKGLSFASGITFTNQNYLPFDVSWPGVGFVNAGVATQNLPYLGLYSNKFFGAPTFCISGMQNGSNAISYATLNNYLFMADGQKFVKFDGVTTTYIGAPNPICCPVVANTGPTTVPGSALGVGATGCYAFYASYVNDRGFEGQIWPIAAVNTLASAATLGGSFIAIQVGFYVPPEYAITKINIYSYWSSATLSCGSTTIWNYPYTYLNSITLAGLSPTTGGGFLAGSTFYACQIGTSAGGITGLPTNQGAQPNLSANQYYPLGLTYTSTSAGFINGFQVPSYYPQFLEVYKTRLFACGFSATPSQVWYSDPTEPEGFQISSSFEVRTDDSDYITGVKAYLSNLYFFKKNSVHQLSGDNAANFNLQELSNIYGAVNNRCIVTFDQHMAFLDRKGVVLFNGAGFQVISTKIQPVFDLMDYNQALTLACATHDKLRNQIIFSFPQTPYGYNNMTAVYDYVLNAWTTYPAFNALGFNPTCYAQVQGRNSTKNVFYGDYNGRVNWFGPSFSSDNGVGITCYFKTRFLHEMGDSTQKQFRRLYLNMDAQSAGVTLNVRFYQDYGSTPVLSRSGSSAIVQTVFQTRSEFGISAKSLAFELWNQAPPAPLRLHGFTIESRLQRRV